MHIAFSCCLVRTCKSFVYCLTDYACLRPYFRSYRHISVLFKGLTMTDTSRNPATMTNQELHAHFSDLLVGRAEDVDARLGEFDTKLTNAMDKIDGLEKSFNDKLDARSRRFWPDCWHPHPPHWHLGMAH